MTILIVGGGKMGLSHFAIANHIAGAGNVAVCDAGWIVRQLFKRFKVRTFSSIENALQSGLNIQGVIIATPTGSHYSIAKSLLEQSIPCFIEKPLTLSAAKSQELLDLANSQRVVSQVGFVLRYVSSFVKLRTWVASGQLGPVKKYVARMSGSVVTKPDTTSWRTNYSMGGGCLNEYGPHLIDLCRFIFGDIAQVGEAKKEHVHSTLADDSVEFRWTHSSGVAGDVSLNWCDTSKRKSVIDFEVEFDQVTLRADNSAFHVTFTENCFLTDQVKAELVTTLIPPKVSYYLRGEEYSLQLEDFIGACLGNNLRADQEFAIDVAANLHDGLEVDRLIEMIAGKVGLR